MQQINLYDNIWHFFGVKQATDLPLEAASQTNCQHQLIYVYLHSFNNLTPELVVCRLNTEY